MEDSDPSVVESSDVSTENCRPTRKYYILHGKCSHSTDNCRHLRAMVKKQKQREKKNFKDYGKSNKELNALVENKFQKFVKNMKRRKQRKNYNTFKKCKFQTMKARKVSQALPRA